MNLPQRETSHLLLPLPTSSLPTPNPHPPTPNPSPGFFTLTPPSTPPARPLQWYGSARWRRGDLACFTHANDLGELGSRRAFKLVREDDMIRGWRRNEGAQGALRASIAAVAAEMDNRHEEVGERGARGSACTHALMHSCTPRRFEVLSFKQLAWPFACH